MSGTIVDDADSAVVYSGNWAAYSGWTTTYKGTTHQSTTRNAQATLTFQGIGVLVNSGQQGVGWRVRSSYSIDSGSPTVYSNDSYQSTTEAYRSPTLSNGQHTLTVIHLDSRAVSLFLDSFIVFTSDDTAVSTSSPSSSTTTTTLTRATTSTTSGSSNSNTAHSGTTTSTSSVGLLAAGSTRSSALRTPDASSTPSPSSASTKSKDPSQIPLIVAPIFGAVVICGIIFLLLRRRQKELPASLITSPPSNDPIRFPPGMVWANGQKPSSFARDANEPPPYVQDPSHSLTPNRQPTKFRTG